MMGTNEWKASKWGQYHILTLGQIGLLQIAGSVGTKPNSDCYQVVWRESEKFGFNIVLDEKFPATHEGLEAAKKRAIEWAKELLQEAMDSLEGGKDVNE